MAKSNLKVINKFDSQPDVQELRELAVHSLSSNRNVQNPALQRVRKKLFDDSHGLVITSYDRMHHRHNRS